MFLQSYKEINYWWNPQTIVLRGSFGTWLQQMSFQLTFEKYLNAANCLLDSRSACQIESDSSSVLLPITTLEKSLTLVQLRAVLKVLKNREFSCARQLVLGPLLLSRVQRACLVVAFPVLSLVMGMWLASMLLSVSRNQLSLESLSNTSCFVQSSEFEYVLPEAYPLSPLLLLQLNVYCSSKLWPCTRS